MSETRKQWLFSFLIFLSVICVANLFVLVTGTETDRIRAAAQMFFVPFWGWVTYHCAYRKRGTAWLMWILNILPIKVVGSIVEDIGKGTLSSSPLESSIYWIFTAVSLFIYGWFWICCLRYRRENLLLKSCAKKPLAATSEKS